MGLAGMSRCTHIYSSKGDFSKAHAQQGPAKVKAAVLLLPGIWGSWATWLGELLPWRASPATELEQGFPEAAKQWAESAAASQGGGGRSL